MVSLRGRGGQMFRVTGVVRFVALERTTSKWLSSRHSGIRPYSRLINADEHQFGMGYLL